MVLEASLKKRGHEVAAVENGLKAWEAFQKEYFPVIISDWMMPEMDGLALCRKVRKLPRENYTYLVLLTSLEGKTNYLEAMDAGADDFMTKPFDADQLTARIQVAERILGLHRHVTQLEGLLPICCSCKKIRDGKQLAASGKLHRDSFRSPFYSWLLPGVLRKMDAQQFSAGRNSEMRGRGSVSVSASASVSERSRPWVRCRS